MAIATDIQVQQYSDERIRPRAEQLRDLINAFRDDKASIDDVYAACAQATPTWTDNRKDGPPKLLTPQDVLSFNAFTSLFLQCIDGTAVTGDVVQLHGNLAVFSAACVDPSTAEVRRLINV